MIASSVAARVPGPIWVKGIVGATAGVAVAFGLDKLLTSNAQPTPAASTPAASTGTVSATPAASTPAASTGTVSATPAASTPAASTGTVSTTPAASTPAASTGTVSATPAASTPAPDGKTHLTISGADPKVAAWQRAINAWAQKHNHAEIKLTEDGAWGKQTQAAYEAMLKEMKLNVSSKSLDAGNKAINALLKEGISLQPGQFVAPSATPAAANGSTKGASHP